MVCRPGPACIRESKVLRAALHVAMRTPHRRNNEAGQCLEATMSRRSRLLAGTGGARLYWLPGAAGKGLRPEQAGGVQAPLLSRPMQTPASDRARRQHGSVRERAAPTWTMQAAPRLHLHQGTDKARALHSGRRARLMLACGLLQSHAWTATFTSGTVHTCRARTSRSLPAQSASAASLLSHPLPVLHAEQPHVAYVVAAPGAPPPAAAALRRAAGSRLSARARSART